jgi:hypothetical protein
MVYTASPHVFPLHNDEFQTENLFRVSISLSDSMPDFAMRFQRHMRTFEMERGFLTAVFMDMHGTGRIGKNQLRGLIEHGTLRPANAAALFFVFDVQASDWAEVLTKLALFCVALGGFGQAAEWVPTLRQTAWAPKGEQLTALYQFISTKTGAGIKITLDFAASLMGGSSTQSGSGDESASKELKITGTTYLTTTDFTTSIKVDVDRAKELKELEGGGSVA